MESIRVSILTSWDLLRLDRAIESIQAQHVMLPFWVEINSQNVDYIQEALALCGKRGVECFVSTSTGKAGVGKQAVFDRFRTHYSEDYLYLLDGDDWLYPCASMSLYHTVSQYKGLDVLTYIPLDVVHNGEWGQGEQIADNTIASFWGDDLAKPNLALLGLGPGKAQWLWTDGVITGPGRTVLFSRKATDRLRWHATIGCYEDTLLLLEALALHQNGELFAANSMAQDTFIYDLTTPEGGQKKNDLALASEQLREIAKGIVPVNRSDAGELPLFYQDAKIAYDEKLAFAKATYSQEKRDSNS